MDHQFGSTAKTLDDLALWEEHRIDRLDRLIKHNGYIDRLSRWRERLVRLKGAARVMRLLASREAEIRVMVPELGPLPPPTPPDEQWIGWRKPAES